VHPQPLSPFNPHEGHDNHVEDVLRTLAELKGGFSRGKGTWSMEFGDDGLSTVVEFERRRIESDKTKVPFVAGSVHFERPVKSQWCTARPLHDIIDGLGLEVVFEESIMEELPMDLGDLDIARSPLPQFLLVSKGRTWRRRDLSGFGQGVV